MKKIFTLIATAFMAFSINAQSDITFGIYTFRMGGTSIGGAGAGAGGAGAGAGGAGAGTGTGSTAVTPITGLSGYTERGTCTYKVVNNGTDTYTIKNFLGGSDYSFTITDTQKGSSTVVGNTITINKQGDYTAPTDYVIFSKNGAESIRFKNITPMPNGTASKFSKNGDELIVRFNVDYNDSFETYSDGQWTKMESTNSVVIGAVIPKIKEGGSSAIENVIDNDDNAPVEYYNLQGVRINEPAAGQVVIRRQGSKVSKVVVR